MRGSRSTERVVEPVLPAGRGCMSVQVVGGWWLVGDGCGWLVVGAGTVCSGRCTVQGGADAEVSWVACSSSMAGVY